MHRLRGVRECLRSKGVCAMSDGTAQVGVAPPVRSSSSLPATKLGWVAVGLALAGVAAAAFGFIVGAVLNAGGPWTINFMLPLLAMGIAGTVCAVVALAKGDRSWAVWLAVVPGLMTLLLLIGEFGSALFGVTH